ncbi:6-methylsalicylic acid decarboxylase atA [Pseudocercospora fuligena]|uniref:6-methylsalicylic acid decarboxylase atA n=1 Tax=Pseudocercospora fuligena TaxID=685502 RepID=A0A8H6RCJ1_9PEZI|nr:6-methylsalicylic acid decarboxylase atA [Pseudocercospora fuligena]
MGSTGTTSPLHIAIVGGGLCGIALGIALKRRHVPFTLYESRSSFTEIGAGINFSPAGVRALRLIDPSLGEKVFQLATRNEPPNEDVWMYWRYGAPGPNNKDGELIKTILSPPTGSMTLHRQELLKALAEEMGSGNAKFNKKLETYSQDETGVTLRFTDGTEERASILVGCDGIHSKVRTTMFGANNKLSKAVFYGSIVYRAVLSMDQLVSTIGEYARSAQILMGPGGYLITYPVNSGKNVNCGFWAYRKDMKWDPDSDWLIPNQGESFQKDQEGWGETVRSVLALYDQDPAMWAAFEHGHQPGHFADERVILIGDGAHSMPPHQGSGAATAVEDAYVLGEVLSLLNGSNDQKAIVEALRATDRIRKPRFQRVHKYSSEGGPRWFDFYKQTLDGLDVEAWIKEGEARLNWIWSFDLEAHAEEAKALYHERVAQS